MNITNVFTDDWLQKLHKKYDRLKPHQRPDLYYIATDKQYQALRQEIETYVATLPSARKLISDLRSPIHFQHTYHELIVGNALLQRGYQPEYDKQIDTLTPDWYVPANAHIPAFLIEVVTTDVSRTRVALQRQVEDLLVRLEAVPVGVVLGITLNDLTVALNPQRVKDMVRQVRTWLSQKPSVGGAKEIHTINFQILRYNSQYSNVHYQGPSIMFKIDEGKLRQAITDKISRYKSLSESNELPLVVAIATELTTGLDFKNLKNVLFGKQVIRQHRHKVFGRVIKREEARKHDGLFGQKPELSAVLWVDQKRDGTVKTALIRNPAAAQPLPANTFF
jgi:hypothetical protein